MTTRLSASVGSYESGARNQAADVRTVQSMLVAAAKKTGIMAFDPKGVDGLIGRPGSRSNTVAAIVSFQRQKVGMHSPDARVDINGATWKALLAVAGTGPAAPPPGLITLTVTHGGKIPTYTKFKEQTEATATDAYESTFTLSGGVSGSFRGSIYPDDMTKKGRVVDGSYPLHIGFHKGGGATKQTAADLVVRKEGIRAGLLINARNSVSVRSDDANKKTSVGVNVHNGYSLTDRGSDGCLTLLPSDWSKFIQLFLDAFPNIDDWHAIGANTGKKVGTLTIKE